mgnify:CR=1 FL=1
MTETDIKLCTDCGAVAWFYIWNVVDDEEAYLCFDCLRNYVKELNEKVSDD